VLSDSDPLMRPVARASAGDDALKLDTNLNIAE
jgi:hypothetical protein